MTKFILPAGKYVVCDPCYCFEHGTYTLERILDAWRINERNPRITYAGKQLLFFNAQGAEGDGWDYPVDSATFGVTPVELVETPHDWLFREEFFMRRGGKPMVSQRGALLIESEGPLVCKREGRWLHVGNLSFDIGEDQERE